MIPEFSKGVVYKVENVYNTRLMLFKKIVFVKNSRLCITFRVIADNSMVPLRSRERDIIFTATAPVVKSIKKVDPLDYPLYINLSNHYKEFESLFKAV